MISTPFFNNPTDPGTVSSWIPLLIEDSKENFLNIFWGEITLDFCEDKINLWIPSSVDCVPSPNCK